MNRKSWNIQFGLIFLVLLSPATPIHTNILTDTCKKVVVDAPLAFLRYCLYARITLLNYILNSDTTNLNTKDAYGLTALHHAILTRSIAHAEMLLKKGANTEIANNYGLYPILIAVLDGNAEMVQLLLQYGANIEATQNNCNALFFAISKNHIQVVKILLAHEANVNAINNKNQTALDYAISLNADPEIIALLKQHGARLTI